MKNKKMLYIAAGLIALVVLVAGGVIAYTKMKGNSGGTSQEETKKKRSAEAVNTIPVAERPYLYIVPESDGHNVTLAVQKIKKAATSLEYELEYQAGSLLQGAFGELELISLPITKTILLGSCSAGGACTYHEDVKGGSLLTRYEGGDNYALKSDWRYINNSARETAFSSKDAKFQLDSPDLKAVRYIVIFNSPGYPDGLTGTPVSDPYSLQITGTLKGKGSLTMRAAEEGALQIMGWNGSTWKAFDTTVDGKMATATVELMELYIVVKK